MSNDGRASVVSVPDQALSARDRDEACAAGTFPARLVGPTLRKPLADEDRVALRLLIGAGQMLRQRDGGWGLRKFSKRLLTVTVANRLKARDLAVPSFDKVTLYPSIKGKRIILAEEGPH